MMMAYTLCSCTCMLISSSKILLMGGGGGGGQRRIITITARETRFHTMNFGISGVSAFMATSSIIRSPPTPMPKPMPVGRTFEQSQKSSSRHLFKRRDHDHDHDHAHAHAHDHDANQDSETAKKSIRHRNSPYILGRSQIDSRLFHTSSSSSSSNMDEKNYLLEQSGAAPQQKVVIPAIEILPSTSTSSTSSTSTSASAAETIVTTQFILIDTKHPGNVGAAARAMKTMGFENNFTLVSPKDVRVLGRKKCTDSASGAVNVLKTAVVYDCLKDALVDIDMNMNMNMNMGSDDDDGDSRDSTRDDSSISDDDDDDDDRTTTTEIIVCGTGMPVQMQNVRPDYLTQAPRDFFHDILQRQRHQTTTHTSRHHHSPPSSENASTRHQHQHQLKQHQRQHHIHIAFLFGNERYGMKEEDIDLCDVMLGIPTNPYFGSLNLASALQLIAYDWRMAIGGFDYDYNTSFVGTESTNDYDDDDDDELDELDK